MAEESEDRLSALPDTILCDHILSRLNQADIFGCNLLSKRWANIWKEVPALTLNYTIKKKLHIDTLNTLLANHSVTLHTFSLCLNRFFCNRDQKHTIKDRVHQWVAMAASKRVQNLDLEYLGVPASLFSCHSLTFLTLRTQISLPPVPTPFSGFQFLVELNFLNIQGVLNDTEFKGFLQVFPKLERLTICNCLELENITVSAPKLVSLRVEYAAEFVTKTPVLTLQCRALTKVSLEGIQIPLCHFASLASLECIELKRVKTEIWDACWSKGNSMKSLRQVGVSVEHDSMKELGLIGFFLFVAPSLQAITVFNSGNAVDFMDGLAMFLRLRGKEFIDVEFK